MRFVIQTLSMANPLSRDAARDLEDALQSETDDMQADLETIFFKHSQLNHERAKVYKIQRTLEARKKWLQEYRNDSPEDTDPE